MEFAYKTGWGSRRLIFLLFGMAAAVRTAKTERQQNSERKTTVAIRVSVCAPSTVTTIAGRVSWEDARLWLRGGSRGGSAVLSSKGRD